MISPVLFSVREKISRFKPFDISVGIYHYPPVPDGVQRQKCAVFFPDSSREEIIAAAIAAFHIIANNSEISRNIIGETSLTFAAA